MPVVMATDRIRLTLLVPDEIRAALRLEAARRDVEMSDLAEEIFRSALGDALKEVQQRKGGRKGGKKGDQSDT